MVFRATNSSTTTMNQTTTLPPPDFSPNIFTSNDAMDDFDSRLDRILDKWFDRILERAEKRLAAPTPTTCSTECPSRDTTTSTSVFTIDTAPTSAAAIVDVVHVLAAPAASDGTLDGDTISGAASTPTTCSTGGTVGDDPGTVFLILPSVAASFTEPLELSRAQLGLDNLAPVACSMKCLVDTNATPSRLLQAAAPALIHELKVLRPLPWPSFKYSQVSTLWQLEIFMNHTKVPSVGIIVQKNNCSKHLVSQAVGRCIFMIRHMWLFPADELFFGGPEIILSAPQFVSSEMQQCPAVCQLIICNEFLETNPTTMKSEVIQGNLSNHSSGIIMNDLCNLRAMRCLDHVFLRRKKLWSNIQCSQLGDANFEASFWPERHIIGSCLASPGHKFSVAIVWEWLYTHILNGQFQEVGNQLTRKCRAQSWLGNILVQIATIQTGANCCFQGTSYQVEKLCCCYWGSDQEMFSYGRVGCRSEANDIEEMAYYICDITYEFYRETLDLVGSLWKTYNFRFNWVSLVGLVQCHNTFLGDVLSAPKLILCMSIKYRAEQKFEGSYSLLAAMELSICTIHKGMLQTVENFRELKSPTTTENNDPNNSVISVSTPHINSISTCSFGLLMGDSNSINNALFELASGQAISQDERNVRLVVSMCCYAAYIHKTKQLRSLLNASCNLATTKSEVIPDSQLQFCWSGSATIILLENFPEGCSQLNCQWRVQSCLGVTLVHISTSQTSADCCARETSDLVEKFSCCFGDSDGTECADTLLLILLCIDGQLEEFMLDKIGPELAVHGKEFVVHGKEVTLCNKIILVFVFHLHADIARWSSYGGNFGEMENHVYVQTNATASLVGALLLKQQMELQYYRNCAINFLHLHRMVSRKVRATGLLVDKFLEASNMYINCDYHGWCFLSSLLSDWQKFGNSITELKEYWDPGGIGSAVFFQCHGWVLQVCQASSQGLIKKSSTWYWYMVFIFHKVQRPGVPMIAWPVCMALRWTTSERWWATCLHCLEPHQWLSMLPACVSRIWLVAWPMGGVELSIHREHPPFQGGRSVTLLATLVDHNYYLDDDSTFDFIHDHLNHGHYRDDYHGDSDMIKDLQAPWDPGDFFVTTAWGQADFQGGRGVSDLP